MGVGKRGQVWAKLPWILKISAKKVVFLVSGRKNKFNHFWPP